MKKIINRPENVVSECAEGFLAAYGEKVEKVPEVSGFKVRNVRDKVALVIGGGSGHEPMFGFFVGENLADASANGNIFASPDPNTILKTALSVERGKGVLFVYGNYSGDNMNFDMAAEMLEDAGIPSRTVRVWDDIASAPRECRQERRGIAGDLFVVKIAGAATADLPLEEAYRVTARARDNTYSIGVALSGGTIPGEAAPAFALAEDEIEFGLGIHGEPGIRREKMMEADRMVEILTELLLEESGIQSGDKVCTFVNGLGSTTKLEMMIVNRKLHSLLTEKEIEIHDMVVDSYVTCQEMAGISVTLLKLDEELERYYDLPCDSIYYKK